MRRPLKSLATLALLTTLGACANSKPAREASATPQTHPAQNSSMEAPVAVTPTPVSQTDAAAATPSPTPMPPAPSAADVRAAIARIYKGAVTTDGREGSVVVGDFNGDGSEDLAARVRAMPDRLSELNNDLANWIVSDPQKVQRPDPRNFDPHQGVQKLPPPAERPRVSASDSLLVVIHGYKEAGWRNPEASQTYLLRDAAGTDLRAQARAEATQASIGQNPPRLMGDVIRQTLHGRQGLLYWNGATYGWFHPEE